VAKLKDAMNNSQQKYDEAKQRQIQKRVQKPVSRGSFIQRFKDLYEINGLGMPPPIDGDTTKKVNGLLKLLKNNNFSDEEIWQFLDEAFASWDKFKQMNFYTDNGKNYILSVYPSLKDIINCKTQFLQELAREEEASHSECNYEEEDMLNIWLNME